MSAKSSRWESIPSAVRWAAIFPQRDANSRNSSRNSGGNWTDDMALPHLDLRHTPPTHFVLLATTNLLQLQTVTYPQGCVFDSAGVYLVEWYCDNVWVADTALLLREI